ncbi:MAG: AAA family ATPase, partial [Desulfurococcales archaeon]|nr:AAA family ATPase [Desulfurococcales archaeon]
IYILLYGNEPLANRYDDFTRSIKGFGSYTTTEILAFVFPEKYVVWNDTTKRGLEKLGVLPDLYSRLNVKEGKPLYVTGERYVKMIEFFKELRDKINSKWDFIKLDQFLAVTKDIFQTNPCYVDGIPSEIQLEINRLIQRNRQLILYGPPGTGKSYIALNYTRECSRLQNKKKGTKVFSVTFHSSYTYEDFVEGIKPSVNTEGEKSLQFRVEEGIFKQASRYAYNVLMEWAGLKGKYEWREDMSVPTKAMSEKDYDKVKNKVKEDWFNVPMVYFFIDEINRGDISRVFGELISLLERDKRLFMDNEMTVTLPYSKKRFGVPPNLVIIGTMNTADRSIALLDVALRRRFGFIPVYPSYAILEDVLVNNDNIHPDCRGIARTAIRALKVLNRRIAEKYDQDHQIGHSYYLKLRDNASSRELCIEVLKTIWFNEIIPLLNEYFYDSPERLGDILSTDTGPPVFMASENGVHRLMNYSEVGDEEFIEGLTRLASSEQD